MLGRTWWWLWLDLKFLSPNPESSCFFVQRSFSAHLSRFGSCRDLAYFSIQFSSDFFDPADLTILILLGSRLDAFEGKCVRGGYCYDHANSGMNPASSLPSRDPSPAFACFASLRCSLLPLLMFRPLRYLHFASPSPKLSPLRIFVSPDLHISYISFAHHLILIPYGLLSFVYISITHTYPFIVFSTEYSTYYKYCSSLYLLL